jgi:hypothetical protein
MSPPKNSNSNWDGASSFTMNTKNRKRKRKVKKIKVADHSISNDFVPKQLNVKNIQQMKSNMQLEKLLIKMDEYTQDFPL